jgi:acetate kinase
MDGIGNAAATARRGRTFVFTAGIGENSPAMRARVVEKLVWLGATLDPAANAAGSASIAGRDSRIGLYSQGIRHNDIYEQMRAIARQLTPDEMKAVAVFYGSQGPELAEKN